MTERLDAEVTFIAATSLECGALRRELPQGRVVQVGIALDRVRNGFGDVVVSCGVAGGLRRELPTGTLLLPREVRRPGGETLLCDEEMIEAFAVAARRLGVEPVFEPLLTSASIVSGASRAQWAERGYAGVDMETGLVRASRVAAVRVVLDTPQREISPDWQRPALAILKPWNWPQALWLAREAPKAAALAARVAAQGIAARMRITN